MLVIVRRLPVLAAALLLFAATLSAVSAALRPEAEAAPAWTTGQFLVASPKMGDPRFARTVIYMVAHDDDGAMGLVVNRAYGEGPLNKLLAGFGVDQSKIATADRVRLHYGGPVEPGRAFVLHTTDYDGPSTIKVDGRLAVSTGPDVLKAVAGGGGPHDRLFILGYAGWGPGQLDGEIDRDDWLTAPADPALVFSTDLDSVWSRAMKAAGWAL